MKFYTAIILATFATLASGCALYEDSEKLKSDKYIEECIEELKIPNSEGEKYKKNLLPDDTETSHCFIKCLLEKLDIFDEDKGFKVDYMYDKMAGGSKADPSGEFLKAIQKCAKNAQPKHEANACKRAYLGAKCFDGPKFLESQKKYIHNLH